MPARPPRNMSKSSPKSSPGSPPNPTPTGNASQQNDDHAEPKSHEKEEHEEQGNGDRMPEDASVTNTPTTLPFSDTLDSEAGDVPAWYTNRHHHGWPPLSEYPPSTLYTITSARAHPAYPEIGPLPTLSSISPSPTTTTDNGVKPEGKRKGSSGPYATIVVPIFVLLVVAVFCIWFRNRRKRQRTLVEKLSAAKPPSREVEMKEDISATASLHGSNASLSVPFPAKLQHAPPSARHPVILGPIARSGIGMDTSDDSSWTSRIVPGYRSADGRSLHDDPPPSYRSRSIAPSSMASTSRNSSLRVPAASRTSVTLQNPFADPDYVDMVSLLSGDPLRRYGDAMSAVSDISYQEDPIVPRSAL